MNNDSDNIFHVFIKTIWDIGTQNWDRIMLITDIYIVVQNLKVFMNLTCPAQLYSRFYYSFCR